MQEDLKRILENPNFIPQHVEVVSFLKSTGLYEYLRIAGNKSLHIHKGDINAAALGGAYAAGWHDCLSLLTEFISAVIKPIQNQSEMPRADFGSLNKAVEAGDLDPQEKEALLNGQQPNYDQYINFKPSTGQ